MAVAAARPGRAEEVGKRLGVAHLSYAELFTSADVDAVVLAARSVDHGPLALEVLRAGKHLFLEKPGATTLAEHDALRAESAGVPPRSCRSGTCAATTRAFSRLTGSSKPAPAGSRSWSC